MVEIVKDLKKDQKELKYAEKKKEGKKKKSKKDLEKLREEKFKIAKKFADELVKKYGNIIKSVVVFGSVARGDMTEESDLDIIVIYDDVAARMPPEVKERFDDDIRSMAKKLDEDMSIQPAWSLSEFWEMARIGHPLLITIVRDGWAVYDTGFFIPFRKLLEMGKIPSTLEAVEVFISNAPQKILKVENMKLYLIAEDLYYAVLNSAQAVLMYMGHNVPSPKNTVKTFRRYLVETGIVPDKYAKVLEKIIEFRKRVEHKEIRDVSGARLDKYIRRAKAFVARMMHLLKQLQNKKKEELAKKNYDTMLKACIIKLEEMNKLTKDPKKLPETIDKNIFKAGMSPTYREIFKRVIAMRKMVEDGEIGKVPERDIELVKNYVDRFIKELGLTEKEIDEKGKILEELMGKQEEKPKDENPKKE